MMTAPGTKDVVLVIADISGYTRFMVSTVLEIEHSQFIISELMQSVMHEVELPLEVSKLEGDAIFLYAVKGGERYDHSWAARAIGGKLLRFFEVFHRKLHDLMHSHGEPDGECACGACGCGACSHMNGLKLKIVVHSGTALFYKLRGFSELSGSDVILVHRLMKNSATRGEYLLLTDAARPDVHFPETLDLIEGSETYEHLGDVKTLTWYPSGEL